MKEGIPNFEPYEGNNKYIFVSYSHRDSEIVIKDLEKLNQLKFRIWYDAGILIGVDYEKSLQDHIKNCKVFLIYVSKNSIISNNVIAERTIAHIVMNDKEVKESDRLVILPVFLEDDIDPTNFGNVFLRGFECIDRWKFMKEQRESDYYDVLFKNIEKIAKDTRLDPIDRDSKTIGIGYLPTLKDVICDKLTSLKPKEQENRRTEIVKNMHDQPVTSYLIDNVFQITSEVTQAQHNLGVLDLDEIDPSKPSNLLSLPLDIKQVYITPLRLISGLITRLDENWPPFVYSYNLLVNNEKKNLLDDLHYYIEFCWFLWGPSLSTVPLLNDNTTPFMVLQAAFGDEANSIPLIMKKKSWDLLINKLGKESYSGWPVSLKNVIAVKPGVDNFFESIRNNYLFKNVFSDPEQVALYLPYHDNDYVNGEILPNAEMMEAFYSTAYIWIMLEQIPKKEIEVNAKLNKFMEPGTVIPFFEHANLATTKGLNFLQHCLARKAIYHVLECERDPAYNDFGYYTFATALFPEKMIEILEEEIHKLNPNDQLTLKKRFRIPKNPAFWRTPVEVIQFTDDLEKVIGECCKDIIKKWGACDSCERKEICSVDAFSYAKQLIL